MTDTNKYACEYFYYLLEKEESDFTLKVNLKNQCTFQEFENLILKLNYCKKVFFFLVHLFARDILVMKKLEIEKTKPTFIISVLKVEY